MKRHLILIVLLMLGSDLAYSQKKYFIYDNNSIYKPATKGQDGAVGTYDVPKYIVKKESGRFN